MTSESSLTVNVIGAGLSGLATAWYLTGAAGDAPAARVRVIEAAAQPGGLIQTSHAPEGLVETAARAFTWTERTGAFFATVGVAPQYARDDSKRRYIFRDGRPRRWPLTPLETAGVAAKFSRAWVGRQVRPRVTESVSEWGARVLGRSATTWLLAPALQGIYASPPSELSAAALFGKKRSRSGKLVAPAHGMGELTRALYDRLRARGVTFEFGRPAAPADLDTADRTIICTNAPSAARLLEGPAPAVARALQRIRMVSLALATSFFQPHPDDLHGFGVLFPRSSGVRALGVLFNTEIFEGRGALRSETWIYGDLDPSALPEAGADMAAAIAADRRVLTGRSDAPVSTYVTTHRHALPVYDAAVLDAQAALPALPPHVAITGNYLGRLGVSSLLDGAAEVAARMQAQVKAA